MISFRRVVQQCSGHGIRTVKNFGHVREKTAPVTVAWHTFLTFTILALLIDWKRMRGIYTGDLGWKGPPQYETDKSKQISK